MKATDTSRLSDPQSDFSNGRMLRTLAAGILVGTVVGVFVARFAVSPDFGSVQVRQGLAPAAGTPTVATVDERLSAAGGVGR